MPYLGDMNDVQQSIADLRDKGWTLAALADEVGANRRTVDRWYVGDLYPQNHKAVLVLLDQLLKRKGVPKQRRYAPGSRQRKAKEEDS